jgi:hypothetical protein
MKNLGKDCSDTRPRRPRFVVLSSATLVPFNPLARVGYAGCCKRSTGPKARVFVRGCHRDN